MVPEPDTANVQPVAEPELEKSSAVRPVTDSENVSVNSTDASLVDDSPEVNPITLGAVVSRVTVGVAVATDDGPVLPASSMTPQTKRGLIVPAEQPDTVRVWVVPEPDTANAQPVAVPRLLKSPPDTKVTLSENVSVYSTDETFVGVAWVVVNPVTLGAVVSRVMVVVAVAADDGPVLPAVSVAPFTVNRGMIVPSEQPDTVTV